MSQKWIVQPLIGKLIGFTKHWNPFNSEVFARVEIDYTVVNVPVDYRQLKFIQKEHPLNSLVPVVFNEGKWQITSRTLASEQKFYGDSSTVFR
jgi:hypothetical protein